jgi:hypothetical protein
VEKKVVAGGDTKWFLRGAKVGTQGASGALDRSSIPSGAGHWRDQVHSMAGILRPRRVPKEIGKALTRCSIRLTSQENLRHVSHQDAVVVHMYGSSSTLRDGKGGFMLTLSMNEPVARL